MSNTFAYAVCGDKHAQRVNESLRFLKKFSKENIVVVTSRCNIPIEHDRVIAVASPECLDDHQSALLLKTSLHRLIDESVQRCCYLDSDVLAVNSAVDSIFHCRSDPIRFAADHVRLRSFSRYAVNCGCVRGECDHLRYAIRRKFNVEVSQADWQHWNGGVFVFDANAFEFLDTWHSYTRLILTDPEWKTRDQGTLIAAAWACGLQDQVPLPRSFNYIVDAMTGVSDHRRPSLRISDYHVDVAYSLDPASDLPKPNFLHFINGMGSPGWKNWDDAANLVRPS